jgi:hypothetical protein
MHLRPWSAWCAIAGFLAVADAAAAAPFTLAQAHPFSFSGIQGTLLPVTAEEIVGTRLCVSLSCTDPEAGDQLFFRITLASGSASLHALAVGTNLVGTGGQAAYVASGQEPIPSGTLTLDSARAFVFPSPGTLDAGETTPVLLNVYANGGIQAVLDAGTLLAVRGVATPSSLSTALGSVGITAIVPEPATALLIALGLAGLSVRRLGRLEIQR